MEQYKEAVRRLTEYAEMSRYTEGYFFCTTFVENKIRMNILRTMAEEMTKRLASVSCDELQKGRFVFWGSTYDMSFYLLFVKYDEVEMFLDSIDEMHVNLDHFQVAQLFVKLEAINIEVVFDIKNEKISPLEILARDYFEKPGFEIKSAENE